MVEVGVAAVAGLDIGAAHGDQALGFGQGLETADAAVRQHEVEHHVMPHEMADKVNVLGREVQAAQDFAGYAGTHAVVLVECPAAVEVFGGVELAHIVEHGGEGTVPVHAEPFFGVALHAFDGVVKHAFDVPVVVALLLNAGQGGDFGHEAVQKLGFKEELHELPHGFGGDLAPFFHDFAGGHVVEDTVGGLDDAHPRVRVDGQIEVRRVAQGTDGEQVVLGERLARQADQLDASGLVEVFELLSFGVVGVGAFELALELEFGEEASKARRDAELAHFRMGGVLNIRTIETQGDAVFLKHGHSAFFSVGDGVGENFEEGFRIAGTGDVHVEYAGFFEDQALQRRIDGIGVVAVAHDGLAERGPGLDFIHEGGLIHELFSCLSDSGIMPIQGRFPLKSRPSRGHQYTL